jgi:hypothetical protein
VGYRFVDHGRPKAYWRAQHYHLTFLPPEAFPCAVPVEVHWHIQRTSRPFRIDLEGLWQRAVPAVIAGVEARVFAPEDLLLHLCLHLCRHAGIPSGDGGLNWRLRAFCDLAAVIHHEGPALDWNVLSQRAQAWGVSPYVYLPLHLTRELCGVAMPASALAALKPDGFDGRLLTWARDELLEDPGPLFPDLLRLWAGGHFKERAAVVRKILSPGVLAKRYAIAPMAAMRYGYYPRRLLDLARRYGSVFWRLVRHDPILTVQAERKAELTAWLRPFTIRTPS